jgi:hypothetical protein
MDEAAVRRHLRMGDLLPAMGRALIEFPVGRGVQPVRSGSGCGRKWLIRAAREQIANGS